MRQRIIETIIIILLLLVTAGLGYWIFTSYRQVWEPVLVELELAAPEAEATGLSASGFIEVRQIDVAPEVSGRIARLLVDEGDQVAQDQVVAEIDTDLLDAEIGEAQAAVEMAEAQLALVEASPRAEQVEVAEAAVAQAETQRNAAYQAWQDAITLRDNPQELNLQIAAVRSQLAVIEHRINQLAALKDAAQLMEDLGEHQVIVVEEGIDFSITLPGGGKISGHREFPEGTKREAWAGWNLASTDLWKAWVNVNQAVAYQEATQRQLDELLALRDNPQQAEIQVARAEADYEQSIAKIESAKANLDKARAGATEEQITVARTAVEQARAALDTLKVQHQKYSLRAPIGGLVTKRIIHQGENVLPGTTLLTLGNLGVVELTVYIPEPDVDKVSPGGRVQVTVDSYPDETFVGQTVWISDQAEYTPKNVQTEEERVNTVFAVKVRIPNPDHKLKPGMPADALLLTR
jgi:multidrug efflux pump subunit AcrA (membrane-fusion protein)